MDYRANYIKNDNALLQIHQEVVTVLSSSHNTSLNKLLRQITLGLDLERLKCVLAHVFEIKSHKIKPLINKKYKRRKR